MTASSPSHTEPIASTTKRNLRAWFTTTCLAMGVAFTTQTQAAPTSQPAANTKPTQPPASQPTTHPKTRPLIKPPQRAQAPTKPHPLAIAKAFLKRYTNAFIKGDANTIAALYHKSPQTRSISSRGDDYKGHKAIKTMFAGSFRFVRFTKTATSQVKARTFGGGLLVYARFTIHSIMRKPPLNRFILRSQGTMLLRQYNGQWQIVHEHFSPIVGQPRIESLPATPPPNDKLESDEPDPPSSRPTKNKDEDEGKSEDRE